MRNAVPPRAVTTISTPINFPFQNRLVPGNPVGFGGPGCVGGSRGSGGARGGLISDKMSDPFVDIETYFNEDDSKP
jgi:hypothetical protein